MSLCVGITGNIGSGKTFVCSVFEHFGVPVFYADTEAKLLYDNDVVKNKVKKHFGEKAYFENDTLNRAYMAECVFNNQKALSFLENILYPILDKQFEKWFRQHLKSDYVLYEAALIFEKNLQKQFDKIILVTAPESLRIERVMKRDASNEEQIRLRMKHQWSETEKLKLADFVIENDGNECLSSKLLSVHQTLTALSKT